MAYFPEEGWLDPVVYAYAMLSAARRRHGAQLICGARVTDLVMSGDRVTGVRLADGGQYEADVDELGKPFMCEHVATWTEGVVTIVRHPWGDPVAGFSASGYLGISDEEQG